MVKPLKTGNTKHFYHDMERQIEREEKAQFDLVKVQHERQQKKRQIEEKLAEINHAIEQRKHQLIGLKKEEAHIKKQTAQQLESEKQMLLEKAQAELKAVEQSTLRYHSLLKTSEMPIGCHFQTIILSAFAEMKPDCFDEPHLTILEDGSVIFFTNVFSKEITVLSGELKYLPKEYQIISVPHQTSSQAMLPQIRQKLKSDDVKLSEDVLHKLAYCLNQPILNDHQPVSVHLIDWLSEETKRQLIYQCIVSQKQSICGLKTVRLQKTAAETVIDHYNQLLKAEILAKNDQNRNQIFAARRQLISVIDKTCGCTIPQTPAKCGRFRRFLFRLFPFWPPKSVKCETVVFNQSINSAAVLQTGFMPNPKFEASVGKLDLLNFIQFEFSAIQKRKAEIQQILSAILKKRTGELKQAVVVKSEQIKRTQEQLSRLTHEKMQLTSKLHESQSQENDKAHELKRTTEKVVYLKQSNTPPFDRKTRSFEKFFPEYMAVLEKSKGMLNGFSLKPEGE